MRHRIALLVLGVAVICSAATPAIALSAPFFTPEFKSRFGPDGTTATEFETAGAIGIDQVTEDVYVAEQGLGTINKFNKSGVPTNFSALGTNTISGFVFFPFSAESQIAVNSTSHDIYVADVGSTAIKAIQQDGEPAEFSALGLSEITGFVEICGVAVDPSGDIYAGDYAGGPTGTGQVTVFSPTGAELTSFETSHPCNVATDADGNVYVNHWQGPVEKFTPSAPPPVTGTTEYSSAGVIDEKQVLGLAVDPATGDLYTAERVVKKTGLNEPFSQVAHFDPSGQLLVRFPIEGGAGEMVFSEGVGVSSAGNVYAADSEGKRQVTIFGPPPALAPTVGPAEASSITTMTAHLEASINPHFYDTHYRFQYVTKAQFDISAFAEATETAEADLGAGGTAQTAEIPVGALLSKTTYIFRVFADNGNGAPVIGLGEFTTPEAGLDLTLPDARKYELVTPAEKLGEAFPREPVGELGGTCSTGIECLPGATARQVMPMQSTPSGDAIVYEGQPMLSRLAPGSNEYLSSRTGASWLTRGLSSPLFANNEGAGYLGFSADLSVGIVRQTEPTLAAGAPSREGKGFENLYLWKANSSPLQPLVVTEPPNRAPGVTSPNRFRVAYAGANAGVSKSAAFTHVIFAANDSLTAAVPTVAPAAPEVPEEHRCKSQGSDENCNLYEWQASELHLVNVLPGNSTASKEAVFGAGLRLSPFWEEEGANVANAISADGSHIFWADDTTGKVYVRVNGIETLEIPSPGACKVSLPEGSRVCFLTASIDGSEVLLSNGQISRFNQEANAYQLATDLTNGQAGFKGILGASDDLTRVYFVDSAPLTPPSEENANGEHAEVGASNLFVWDHGSTRFIAKLLGGDNSFGSGVRGDWKAAPEPRTSQISPNGSLLAFMSRARLTGQSNEPKGGGTCGIRPAPCYEVFEYDLASDDLTCVSCNPARQRPLDSSNINATRHTQTSAPIPQPNNLTAGGRLFFESRDVLSPRDNNGHIQDVYEWEPGGVGSCTRPNGCVSLISSGTSGADSFFLNATPSGKDVFFVTRQGLVQQDQDEKLDVYDARVEGGFITTEVGVCNGEGCKGPTLPSPTPPAVGSAAFAGPGNPKPSCTPGYAKKRGKCIKRKKKKKHASRHARHAQRPVDIGRGGGR